MTTQRFSWPLSHPVMTLPKTLQNHPKITTRIGDDLSTRVGKKMLHALNTHHQKDLSTKNPQKPRQISPANLAFALLNQSQNKVTEHVRRVTLDAQGVTMIAEIFPSGETVLLAQSSHGTRVLPQPLWGGHTVGDEDILAILAENEIQNQTLNPSTFTSWWWWTQEKRNTSKHIVEHLNALTDGFFTTPLLKPLFHSGRTYTDKKEDIAWILPSFSLCPTTGHIVVQDDVHAQNPFKAVTRQFWKDVLMTCLQNPEADSTILEDALLCTILKVPREAPHVHVCLSHTHCLTRDLPKIDPLESRHQSLQRQKWRQEFLKNHPQWKVFLQNLQKTPLTD